MQVGEFIAKRYRVERLVGSGGTADVYEVTDSASGGRLALKRLNAEEANGDFSAVMLAREYNALAQLSHPLIIRAFDYGLDGKVPYYTMELLCGENLRNLAPLGWRDACDVVRDVASALAIVHSRRLVHRDVTTRNVCRVADGHAKLLDFGTLTPMGPVRDLVGTPPFVPPEAVEEQRLDGRADLFALGAVAYFILTGQHAYPARTFRELGEAWRYPVSPPSVHAKDVPAALDELVLSLLSLARTARPQNAAEVFQRLTAIAELPPVEAPEVARAYLATPSLVGRDRPLGRFRRHLERIRLGRGAAVLVESKPGLGRTRLLGAFLLEAKLRGFLTLRANGRDTGDTPFGLARVLTRALLAGESTLASEELGADAPAITRLLEADAPPTRIDEENWHPDAQRFADFIARVATRTPLVIGVDDVDGADAPSLTMLALLSQRARERSLELVLTSELGEGGLALAELRRTTTKLVLEHFTEADTRTLVSSLFGDVPNVEGLAEWMHRLTGGNPRASLELAQHLVERNIATYQEGVWTLPESLEGLGLPETFDQALDAKFAGLRPFARKLLQTLSLMTDHDPLLVTEYGALIEGEPPGRVFKALNELIAASILVSAGTAFVFSHDQLVQAARRTIPKDLRPELHRRLARAYASGTSRGTVLVVYHLYQSGDLAAAFRAAVEAISQRVNASARGSALARSPVTAKITESLFVWGHQNGMSRKDLVLLGRSLLQLASVSNVELSPHIDLILEPLRRETGLVYWDELGDVADETARMQACLGRAFAEYENTPEEKRGLHPFTAIAELATSAGMLIGVSTRELDPKRADEVTALLRPLRPLSPAVDVVAQLVELATKAIRGLSALEDRRRVLARVSAPLPGLDDLSRDGMRLVTLYYLALEEAVHGRESAAERVAPLDEYPHLAPLAWQVRMLVHLYRGEDRKAAAARRRRDAASVGRVDVDRHLDSSVIYEAGTSSLLGDLLALKRSVTTIGERWKGLPGWTPYYHAFKGSYHALRGEMGKALEEQQRAFALVPKPGVHSAWAYCVNHLAGTLVELDRAAEAEELVTQAIADAQGISLVPYVPAQLEMSLALAKAALGKGEEATRHAKHAMDVMTATGMGGVILVDHYAKQALVALKTHDRATFRVAASTIETMCAHAESVPFAAKYEFLLRQARSTGSFHPVAPARAELVTKRESHTTVALGLRTELERCEDSSERARRVLGILLDWSGTDTGYLYLQKQSQLSFVASSSGTEPPESLERTVETWTRSFMAGEVPTHTSSRPSDSDEASDFDTVGLVAYRDDGPLLAGVVALSRSDASRVIPESILDALGEGLIAAGDAVGLRCGL